MAANRAGVRVLIILATVCSLLVTVGAAGVMWVQVRLGEIQTIPIPSPEAADPTGTESPIPPPSDCKKTCTFLVLGSDSRAGLSSKDQREFGSDAEIEGFRSDTMLMVHIDREAQHTTIVSFPRDLLVEIPGVPGLDGYGGKNLINAAFSEGATDGGLDGIEGGAVLSAQTVQRLTGMRIDHIVVIDLEGFKTVVDAMGSSPICLSAPMRDDPQAFGEPAENQGSGLNLDKGCHDLDGDTALAFVRARYVVSGGVKDCISDYARIQRQQQFMRGMMNKLLSPSNIHNVPDIINDVTQKGSGIVLDKDIQISDLVSLFGAMRGIASGNADFRVVPNQLDAQNIHLEITSEGQEFLRRLRGGESLGELGTELQYQPPGPAEIAVRVYDDDSKGHAQNDVYNEQLRDGGFKLMAASAEPAGDFAGRGTVILYAPGSEEEAGVLSGFVPGVDVQKAEKGELPEDTEVAVVVDETYKYKDPGDGKTQEVTEECPFNE